MFLLSCHESLAVRSVDAHVPVQIAGLGEPVGDGQRMNKIYAVFNAKIRFMLSFVLFHT